MGKVDPIILLIQKYRDAEIREALNPSKLAADECRKTWAELRTALTACVAEWQGMESAPRDRRVLVWTGLNQYAAQWVQNPVTGDTAWLIGDNGDGEQLIVQATRWQPLPPPPTTEGETK